MYSIFDNDVGRYLATGRNSKTKREALECYLFYRNEDFFSDIEIDSYEKLKKEIKKTKNIDILQDMAFCNFELVKHKEKLPEEWRCVKNAKLL